MGPRIATNVSAMFVALLVAMIMAGCGSGADKEEDSMAPLLEKAAREQGLDSNTVKTRGNEMPQGDPKAVQKDPNQDPK